jgi:phenylpropionate dioxygenase-like ring-hydroxylating dioxygenase large terminal subunit
MSVLGELAGLVGWERGRISPAIYFDEQVYRREQARVFEEGWVPVGHVDMVRDPGDYVTTYMGEVPVIVVRGRDGRVRVLVNKCRHRGNQVCLFDRGNVPGFTCSYHGWAYGTDGRLISVPEEQQFYHGALDKEQLGLQEARAADYCGLLFATLGGGAPELEDWLGEDVRWWLRYFVLAEPVGGLEALPGWHRYESPANWKLIAENFIGDNYHFAHTHTSWLRVRQAFQEQGILTPMTTAPHSAIHGGGGKYSVTAGYRSRAPLGLGAMITNGEALYERDLEHARALGKEALEWVRERDDRMSKALAGYEPRPAYFGHGLLFPNLGLMGYVSPMTGKHFLLFHPRGPLAHEIWQWTMVEREAPDSVKEIAVQRVYQGQHMAGVIAPDDVENFERIVEASHSPGTWRYPMNYEIHLGHDQDQLPHLPGNISAEPSEVNQREFYRFWLELMRPDGPEQGGQA